MERDERIAEILGVWQERRERGESIEPAALIAAHPDLADDLSERLAALGYLDLALANASDVPSRIGDFRIVREISRGGMGVVYEAEQLSMHRRVALKVLSLAITTSPQAVKRFQREARAAGRLHHTNIVPIHDLGQHAGYWYYTMELVEGRPLGEVLAAMRGSVPTEAALARHAVGGDPSSMLVPDTRTGSRAYYLRVAEMFAGVAEGLHLAHESGVIHRDIKPSNLLLDVDGTLKIIDFGLALTLEEGGPVTLTGDLLGTPAYMSPEQTTARRGAIDRRTDVYSLGATLYEVLTLAPPFRGRTWQELCSQIAKDDPVLPRRGDRRVPRDLETIVCKAMEKRRSRRYATAAEFARDLRRFADGQVIAARRVGPVGRAWRRVRRHRLRAALVAAVLLLAVVGILVGLTAARERERRKELEYAALCAAGEGFVVRLGPWWLHETAALRVRARDRFTRAIAVAPERPEAYVGRALVAAVLPGALADLDAAQARGLAARTYHLARSLAFDRHHRGRDAEEERRLAAAHPGGSALDLYFEARVLEQRGKREQALQLLGRALDAATRSRTVRFLALRLRGELRREAGDYAGALTDLLGVQGMGDASLDLRLRIASLWRAKGDEEEAARIFDETLAEAVRHGRAHAWVSLARSCRMSGEAEWLDRVTQEALKKHKDDPALLVERAVFLEATGRGDAQEVLALAERALAKAPGNHFALVCKADAQLALGQPREAAASYREALESDPQCLRTLQQLGRALRKAGEPAEALDAYDRALEVKPNDTETWCLRGDVLRQEGQYDKARAAYTRAIDSGRTGDAGLAQAYYLRGCLLADNMKRDAEALRDFRKALDIDPRHFESQRCCAIVLKKMGKLDAALVEIRRARDLEPDSSQPYATEAAILVAMGEVEEAHKALSRGVDAVPEDASLRNRRGALRSNVLRKHADAIRDFRAAQELDDVAWKPHANEAIALFYLDKVPEAIAALDRALERTDEAAQPAYLKGEFLLRLGEYERATDAFLIAIERAPKWVKPREGLSHALHSRGQWKLGLEKVEEALERFGNGLYFQRERVTFLRALGQAKQARQAAREYEARGKPKDGPLYFAYLCAAAGKAERARAILKRMRLDGSGHASAAGIHAVCGDADAALASLETAVARGYRVPPNTAPDPDLEALLGDNARYRELVAKLASD
jgi:tetratricopeptide (TPR) repeat protein/RIO-like serine/threonine protein kinase